MRTAKFFIHATFWTIALCAIFSLSAKAQSINATAQVDATRQSDEATTQNATSRSRYVISASAGAINFVSGEATWRHADESDPRTLTKNDDLQSGDKLATGANGFVEMLLSPGTYLRIGANSSVELTSANLDDVRVTVSKGSVIVEATGFGGAESIVRFKTPQTSILIAQTGVYRINVSVQATEVLVRNGEASVGCEVGTIVKKNKKLTITSGANAASSEVASIDKKAQDELDYLSKERAKILAGSNALLARAKLGDAVFGFVNSGWSWQSYNGLWAYNSLFGCYTFLPFGYYNSPYGFGYNSIVIIRPVFNRGQKPTFPVHLPHPPNRGARESTGVANNTRHGGNGSASTMSDMKSNAMHTMPVRSEPTHTMPSHSTPERIFSAPSSMPVYSSPAVSTTSASSGRSGKQQ